MIREIRVYEVAYVAVCEECGKEGPIKYRDYTAADAAKKAGWLLVGDAHFCPEHVNSPMAEQSKIDLQNQKRHEGFMALANALKEFKEKQEKEKDDPPKTE